MAWFSAAGAFFLLHVLIQAFVSASFFFFFLYVLKYVLSALSMQSGLILVCKVKKLFCVLSSTREHIKHFLHSDQCHALHMVGSVNPDLNRSFESFIPHPFHLVLLWHKSLMPFKDMILGISSFSQVYSIFSHYWSGSGTGHHVVGTISRKKM